MSYNVTHCEVIELTNLAIPEDFFDELELDSELLYGRGGKLTIDLSEQGGFSGVVRDGMFYVDKFEYGGGGSGSNFDTVKLLLDRSTGTFAAILTWEGGENHTLLESDGEHLRDDHIDIAGLIRRVRELEAKLNGGAS